MAWCVLHRFPRPEWADLSALLLPAIEVQFQPDKGLRSFCSEREPLGHYSKSDRHGGASCDHLSPIHLKIAVRQMNERILIEVRENLPAQAVSAQSAH